MNVPDAAIGSIIAAAIAGLVVFVSTVLTKEQKTSEFRQVWIDEIRNDISQYIAGVVEVVSMAKYKKGDLEGYKKFLDDKFSEIQTLSALEHRIILRLNPEEHKILVDEIRSFRPSMMAAYEEPSTRKQTEDALIDKLTKETKKILSSEWNRVKKGEPTFRIVKWAALFLIVLFVCFLAYLFYASKPSQVVEKSNVEKPFINNQVIQYFAPPTEVIPTKKPQSRRVQNNAIIFEAPINVNPASIPDEKK